MNQACTLLRFLNLHIKSVVVIIMLAAGSPLVAQLPHPAHIIVLIEENHSSAHVIGDTVNAPYINKIARDSEGVILSAMYAIEHPSQPNYLDFFSGSNQGVTSDNLPTNYPFVTPNLARELLDKGLTFITYSQGLPSVGSDTVNYGPYVRKHNPVTNWVGTGTNQVPDTLNQPFTNFPSDYSKLPAVCYVVANEDSDMHTGTVAAGDFWFKEHLQSLINWVADPANNALFIYTFDEDDYSAANNIPTVFWGPMVKPGIDSTQYNHYSTLATIEDIYSLGHAGAAATNPPITDCWKAVTAVVSTPAINLVKCYPDPVSSLLQFKGDALSNTSTIIELTDITGKRLTRMQANGSDILTANVAGYSNGIYCYKIISAGLTLQSGKFVVTH